MKVLVVCAGSGRSDFQLKNDKPFVYEQVEALKKRGIEIDVHVIKGGGYKYFTESFKIRRKVKQGSYDIVHSHYGLSGLVNMAITGAKKITTFHGSDINRKFNNFLSSLSAFFAHYSIFVSEKLYQKIYLRPINYDIIPCGINLDIFYPIPKKEAIKRTGLNPKKVNILFSSAFSNPIKNYPLAQKATALLKRKHAMIELKGKTRPEVNLLMNACDVLLLTSFSEGSPQVIKEAMACGLPIVSTDVGEVKKIIDDTKGCWVTSFEPVDVAAKLRMALDFKSRTNGREKIQHLNNNEISHRIYCIYKIMTEATSHD